MNRARDLLCVVAAIAAVTAAVRMVRGTGASRYAAGPALTVPAEDAAAATRGGTLVGDSAASVRIVEFSDFECRYCRRAHPTLVRFREQHQNSVAIVYRNFPLSRVGFSMPAAIAAQCAALQGRYEQFAALLYASQDTLSRLSLERVALAAGVADTGAFAACRCASKTRMQVQADMIVGHRVGVRSTPSFLIGGQLHVGELSAERLAALTLAERERVERRSEAR